MDRLRHSLRGVTLVLSLGSGAVMHAQPSYAPFEVQIGVQVPTGPLYKDQFTYVSRSAGPSIGLLLYSYPDNPIGFRMRADFALNHLKTTGSDRSSGSEEIREFAFGVDAVPSIIRLSAGGVEARFYAGFALRVMLNMNDDDVTILDGPGGVSDTWQYGGSGFGVVGRAGWFVRRATKASPLRLDVGYQIGEANGAVQHELVLRAGFGGY